MCASYAANATAMEPPRENPTRWNEGAPVQGSGDDERVSRIWVV